MSRASCTFFLTLLGLVASACVGEEDDLGSNTNWWTKCDMDADCGQNLSCLCGMCTLPCADSCQELGSDARCSASVSNSLCNDNQVSKAPNLCVLGCVSSNDCGPEQACFSGVCTPLSGQPCDRAAEIEFLDSAELWGRQGSWISDELYLPVEFATEPVDWDNTSGNREFSVQVLDGDRNPVLGCQVAFYSDSSAGLAISHASVTDNSGVAQASFIAGAEELQTLTAVVLDEAGRPISTSRTATVYAHNDGPAASEAGTETVRPSTINVGFAVDDTTTGISAVTTPITFPHHGFYSPFTLPGMFAGLLNTSSLDGSDPALPPDARIFQVKVWNTEFFGAEVLSQDTAFVCESTALGEVDGGLTCRVENAWRLGEPHWTEVEWVTSTLGETATWSDGSAGVMCSSDEGCLDYSISLFSDAQKAPYEIRLRYPNSGLPYYNGAFLQPYSRTDSQTSCLLTPAYTVDFEFSKLVGTERTEVTHFDASYVYKSWNNEVCANMSLSLQDSGFRLSSGGDAQWGLPWLPGDADWSIDLVSDPP